MARERPNHGEREIEENLHAREAQDGDNHSPTGSNTFGQSERFVRPDAGAAGEQSADWSDQPTQPQRRIQGHRNWPTQSSGNHPEWPLRAASTGEATSPLHRLLDAAHERQFNLGCGTLAALVLIVAAFLAAFTNGWLSTNAGPIDPQPSIQASPPQFVTPMPTITPSPPPTATPIPTDTPIPTVTPIPIDTPIPTIPTHTPVPTPTATPLPATPVPTQKPIATPQFPSTPTPSK